MLLIRSFTFPLRRVHISASTYTCVKNDYVVEPGEGHLRNDYIKETGVTTYLIVKKISREEKKNIDNVSIYSERKYAGRGH